MSEESNQNIPSAMRSERRWIVWRYEVVKGKKTKVPYQPGGAKASSTRAAEWTDFDSVSAGNGHFDGIGFVLGDGWMGVDLDECIVDGVPCEEAAGIISELNSYTEISPSGLGVKIFMRGSKPKGWCKVKPKTFKAIEAYDSGRYFTVTGRMLDGSTVDVADRTDAMRELHERFSSKEDAAPDYVTTGKVGVVSQSTIKIGFGGDDTDLLKAAMSAANGEKFRGLWGGDAGEDHSFADNSLCCHLAFWAGPNPQRIDRLFRQSGLMRAKWDERRGTTTYGQRTISEVLKKCKEFYEDDDLIIPSANGSAPHVLMVDEEAIKAMPPREQALAELRKLLRVPISRWVQYCPEAGHETYYMYLEGVEDPVCIGKASAVVSRSAFKTAVYAQSNMVVSASGKLWNKVLRQLAMIREVVNVPEDTREGQLSSAINRFLEDQTVHDVTEKQEAVRLKSPFVENGLIYVHMESLKQWMVMNRMPVDLFYKTLLHMDWERHTVSFDNTSRSYWRTHMENLRQVGVDEAEPADRGRL